MSRQSKKLSFGSKFSERMCEQIGVIEVPKIQPGECRGSQKFVPQERISEWMCEQIGVIEVPKISGQESVKAVRKCPSEANSREDV